MNTLPNKLSDKLNKRIQYNALRTLPLPQHGVDFSSNDYLGFATSKEIFEETHLFLKEHGIISNGATGSRLLSGNHTLYNTTEHILASFHHSEAALLYNSGYDANLGLFAAVPQRGDIILYDELIHASIRDGIQMSHAKSYKFAHNDWNDLEKKINKLQENALPHQEIYIATESVFSMDGDCPDLLSLVTLCEQYKVHLIIDDAHAVGVFGTQGCGLVQQLGIEHRIFARVTTFGKAMGCHGAVILGSKELKQYLINFSRSFIYTTALPPHALATIQIAYQILKTTPELKKLQENITFFNQVVTDEQLIPFFIESHSAIHSCILSGNDYVKKIAAKIQQQGFDVKPILSPTVPKGKERLRFCLHSYNSKAEIAEVLKVLATFVV